MDVVDRILEIVELIQELAYRHIDERGLAVDYATIFSHSEEESDELVEKSKFLGKEIDYHNGPVFQFETPLQTPAGLLKIFRIRKPDTLRPQKGCGDLVISDYPAFKKKYCSLENRQFEIIPYPDFEMIEIKDPSIDALVYFPDIPLTSVYKL